MITVTIQGIEDTEAALKRLSDPDLPRDIAKRVADEVVQPRLSQYPSPSGRSQPFRSDKSRRYFFAALRSGRIRVPYPRSGRLGSPSNWAQTPEQDGLTLKSTTPYSDMVIGDGGKQARYFFGTWSTVQEMVDEREAEVALSATARIVERIGDAGP